VPDRAREWTCVPHSSFPRNEGVPGSSPGVGFLAHLQEVLLEPATSCTGSDTALGALRVRSGYVRDPFSVGEVVPLARDESWAFAGESRTRGRHMRVPSRTRECPSVAAHPHSSSLVSRSERQLTWFEQSQWGRLSAGARRAPSARERRADVRLERPARGS
jgi:hypothetical protein